MTPASGTASLDGVALRRLPLAARIGAVLARSAVVPLLLSGLVLISLLIRVPGLDAHLWVDEGISVGIASHSLVAIPGLLAQDGAPPLYYLMLHVWMAVLGRSEVSTHELSLAFALLTIPAAFWAAASTVGRRAGWIAAALAAFNPFVTVYAQETRMYSLIILLGLVTATAFVHVFVLRRRRYLPLFVAGLTLDLYAHNWALFLGAAAVGAFGWCAFVAPVERRALLRDGAIAFGAVALLYLPWIPTLAEQALHTGAPWAERPVLWSLTRGMWALGGGRGASAALVVASAAGFASLKVVSSNRSARMVVALLGLGLGTLVAGWLVSKVSGTWAVRYMAVGLGPLLLLCAVGVARAGGIGLLALALALVLGFWVLDPAVHKVDRKSNVAVVAAPARHVLQRGDLVLTTQPEQVPTLHYYARPGLRYATSIGVVPDPGVVDWRNALARLRRPSHVLRPLLRGVPRGGHVWLVLPVVHSRRSEWLRVIALRTRQWHHVLERDRSFVAVQDLRTHADGAVAAVRSILYVKR